MSRRWRCRDGPIEKVGARQNCRDQLGDPGIETTWFAATRVVKPHEPAHVGVGYGTAERLRREMSRDPLCTGPLFGLAPGLADENLRAACAQGQAMGRVRSYDLDAVPDDRHAEHLAAAGLSRIVAQRPGSLDESRSDRVLAGLDLRRYARHLGRQGLATFGTVAIGNGQVGRAADLSAGDFRPINEDDQSSRSFHTARIQPGVDAVRVKEVEAVLSISGEDMCKAHSAAGA